MRLLLFAATLCLVLITVQGAIESTHDAQFQAALTEARRHLIIKIRQNGEGVASSFGPIVKRIAPLHMWVIRVDDDDIEAKMAEIRQHPDVLSVEQDGIGTTGFAINDPLAPQQWALTKLRAYEVWDLVRINPAANITIAVADTGVEYNHEDLVDVHYLPGYDFVNLDNDPFDDNGHGTHVTGIIAATQNNAKGVSGLAPGVSIMPFKVLGASNGGTWSDVISALTYAGNAGMNIISMSIQGYGPTDSINDAVNYATSKGTLVVACAGNLYYDGNIPSLPGAANNSFAVTNLQIDANGVYSRYGASNTGDYIDIAAPGTDILSTYPTNSYASLTGCSMATPYVSALAALVWSVNPSFTNFEVRSIIESTAIDLGAPGRDDEYGNGAIDPLAAVRKALQLTGTPVSVPPASSPVATPVSTPVATPVSTPVSTPVAAPVSTPVATPVSTPVATPVSIPVSTPVTVPPSGRVIADTFVRDGVYANNNYGSATTLQVKNDTTPDWSRWTWVKINLSGLNNLASLTLNLYGGRDDGSYSILGAFRASSSWDENTLTWNNQPAIGNLLTSVNVSTIGWYHFDLTAYANELINSGQSTLTVVIKSLFQSSAGFTSFESRESASVDLRPRVDTSSNTPVSTQTFVYPSDDATVRSGTYANDNYALEPTMYIKFSTDPNFTRQIYVKFPIAGLTSVGSQRVVVRLFGYYQSTIAPLTVQCYSVPDVSWSQSTITWNNKPALGVLLTSTDIGHPIAYYEFDVTSYVSGRQSAGASFVSFAFVRTTPGPDESTVLINSREADVNRPILAVVAGGANEAQFGSSGKDQAVSSASTLISFVHVSLVIVLFL